MASNNDNGKRKFDWPDKYVTIFCDNLKDSFMKNGRNTLIKWQDLQLAFEKDAGIKLNSFKPLKNKYDGMKKDYNLWKSLRIAETGLCWNESTKQINCPDEWWDKKIKENPNVKPMRKKQPSLELQDAWDQIYGDSVASGADCVAPSMAPSAFNDIPNVFLDSENNTMVDDTFLESSPVDNLENDNGTFYVDLMNLASDILSPGHYGGSTQPEKSSKESTKPKPVQMKRKSRESAGSAMLKDFIAKQNATQQRTLAILESDTSTVTQSREFSISAAVSLINRMVDDGILTKAGELWCFAMVLFEDAVKRELFISFPDDEARLAWLNYQKSVGN